MDQVRPIKTEDADYRPAKHTVIIISAATALFYLCRIFHIIVITPF